MRKITPIAFFPVLIFLNTFIIAGSLRKRAYGSDTLDFQIFIKLGFWAVVFALCLIYIRSWAGKLVRFDNFLLLPLLILIFISCFYAPSPNYSLGAAFSITSILALMYASASVLEPKRILGSLLASITVLTGVSIILYFIWPEYGRGKEWVNGIQVPGRRLSGIGGPNGIGFLSSLSILISLYYRKFNDGITPRLIYPATLINVIALLMSNSRSPLAALIVTLAAVFFLRKSIPRLAFLCIGIGVAAVVAVTMDWTPVLESLSRSGDAAEIETGTGRIYIWHVVLQLIEQRPWTGWGYASSSFIIPKHASDIGHAPSHSHNLFLHIAFSIGCIGLFIFVSLIVIKFVTAMRQEDRFKMALILFVCLHGMTESSIFQGAGGNAAVVFAIIMALDKYKSDDRKLHAQ